MLNLDVRNLSILGASAAALIAGIYVLWGPTGRKKKTRKKDWCPGLVNLGNTCFLNAVLQALAPCPSVTLWLADSVDQQSRQRRKYTSSLAYTLFRTLKLLNNDLYEVDDDDHCPADIIEALRRNRWVISPDEQDAHELLHVLTETLEEDTAKFPRVLSLFDLDHLQITGSQSHGTLGRCRGELPSLPARDGDLPFRGLLASQLQCRKCGYKCPVKYDKFDSLSLSLPNSSLAMGALSVERLLKQYISSETVQNVDCEGCAKVSSQGQGHEPSNVPKSSFIKRLTIGKLPPCLCLHIQRTVWLNSGVPMKRYEHVDFPETFCLDEYVYHKRAAQSQQGGLNGVELGLGLFGGRKGLNGYKHGNVQRGQGAVSPTVPYSRPLSLLKALNYQQRSRQSGLAVQQAARSRAEEAHLQHLAATFQAASAVAGPGGDHVYRLAAVVAHLGEVFSGHFITYRRAPSAGGSTRSDRWLYTSDTTVRKATIGEVLGADAYMLFYERI